jgi:hypothetical protein
MFSYPIPLFKNFKTQRDQTAKNTTEKLRARRKIFRAEAQRRRDFLENGSAIPIQ